MGNTFKLIWSEESLNNLKSIIDFLEIRWTNREIKRFAQLLDRQINLIKINPHLYPESEYSEGLRKSVLTKQVTIYYRIVQNEIHIISLFDSRQYPGKIKKF